MSPLQISDRLVLRRIGALLSSASGVAFFLISLGSLVRAAQAGLSCPDWPLCFGELIPSFDTAIFLEWFHRLVAGMLAIVMALASFKILSSGYLRKVLGTQIFAAMILLGIQVTLGGLTVLKLLEAKTVAAHLLNALLFYAVLLWMTFRVKRLALDPSALKSYKIPGTTKGLFLAVTLALFAQIALGGMVSSNFAGMVCPDFPQCHGEWLPPSLFPFVIQMLHRAAGVVVLAFAMVLWVATYRLKLPPLAHYAVRLTPWMLIIQIGLGVFNVLYALPIAASAAHLANAVAIYTLMILGTLSVFTDGEHQGQMPTQDTLSETPSLLVEGVT